MGGWLLKLLLSWFGIVTFAGVCFLVVVVFCRLVEKFPPVAKTNQRALLRCDCGALFWSDDQKKIMKHVGHHHRYATEGTHWEMFKVKVGLI